MNDITQQFPLWMMLLALKSSLVLAGARFWAWRLSAAPPTSRHVLWTTALLGTLALPLLSMAPLEIEVPLQTRGRFGDTADAWPFRDSTRSENPSAESRPANSRVVASAHDATPPARGARHSRLGATSATWERWVLGFYALGAGILTARLVLGNVRARSLIRAAVPLEKHRAWRHSFGSLPTQHVRWCALRVSNELHAPATCGVLRPIVLLPESATAWPEALRRSALVHELSHVARRDGLTQLLGALGCVVYWFNPLVWFAARQLHLEAERACDARVVRFGSDPHDYAQQLVGLTRRQRHRVLAAVAMASHSELADRVATILAHGRPPMARHRLWSCVAVVATATVLLTSLLAITGASQPSPSRDGRAIDRREWTPLMQAAARGDEREARRLIAAGADVNARRRAEGTALILAATYGNDDVVRLLIDAGADVNLSEGAGRCDGLLRTPLASAARAGSFEIVTLLLDHGARVDAAPRGDATALMEAAENGHLRIVELLLERGAQVDRRVDGDGTALIAAARGGDRSVVRTLVEAGADVNRGVAGDGNALIAAVRNGDRAMVRYLLQQGADPNAYVPGDETALLAAAVAGSRDLLLLLLDAADKN